MEAPKIFISHRHADKVIADVVRTHLMYWGVSSSSIYQSSAVDSGPRVGASLSSELKDALFEINFFILIHTFADQDWSYCMWEAGVSSDPSSTTTRMIVLQCTKDVPTPFADGVRVKLDLEDITRFVDNFHRGYSFFPGKSAWMPQINDEAIHKRAQELYDSLRQVAPREGLSSWEQYEKLIEAHSIFGAPDQHLPRYDIFILMPFGKDKRPIYEDHLRSCAKRLNLSCGRADDFFSTNAIMHDVWSGICRSRLIVADCTGRNPNVFYEIGIAHTLDKPTILISQSLDDVPFDLRHRRVFLYEFTPRGMVKFEKEFEKTVSAVLRGTD